MNKKMNRIKKQQYKVGAIVKIKLADGRFAFGRLMPGVASTICIYDFIVNENEIPYIEEIVNKSVLFCCGLYRFVITKGIFEIVGIKEFSHEEIDEMLPVFFTQDLVNINDCVIYGFGKKERKATAIECINLERSSVWGAENIIERIEDHYAGRKNFYVEDQKVILSKDDPRYLAPPGALRWDFEKQKFYRIDK
ncbi:MAG: hypothetical protein JST34_16190 [Bacteroidetes bacterium]|nr:hypothetical protein [Bacteroidota bacterium]MBX2887992.1 hypothetical protein [Ferruginibacter sp.]